MLPLTWHANHTILTVNPGELSKPLLNLRAEYQSVQAWTVEKGRWIGVLQIDLAVGFHKHEASQ